MNVKEDKYFNVTKMNNKFQKKDRSKPHFIFEEDQSNFIKREPVINEELEITSVIDLDAVKTEQDEPNQSEKNDLNFPIETLSNFPIARNKTKITKHYKPTPTSKNSDNITVPQLIENSLPNETQPVEIKIETIEQIDVKEHITFEPIAEVDVKENIIFEPLELDIKVKIEENVVKQQLGIDGTDNLINGKSALKDTAQKVARKAQKPGRKRAFKYTCDFCDEKFTTKCKMYEHIRTHKGKKPDLSVHVMAQGGVPFACNLCKFVTCTRVELKLHMVKFHDMKSDNYMCHHCRSSFSNKDHLIEHLKFQSNNFTSHYICSHPQYKMFGKYQYDTLTKKEKKFIDNYELFTHPYECAVCPYKCTIKAHVRAHMRAHNAMLARKHGSLKNSYLCKICKFKSTKERDLNQHMKKIHQQSKPLKSKFL